MIRLCTKKDIQTIYEIINDAATAYSGHIPDDCYHQPYMQMDELQLEMSRVTFYGWTENNKLKGIMGLEQVKDVTLLRHAYVFTGFQGLGIGRQLLHHIESKTNTKILLVGTWADATWAVNFYKTQGFEILPDKDVLLKTYWDIPQRQIETSVVLGKTTG
jgi:GNAT superfamily N-acetyltransferase